MFENNGYDHLRVEVSPAWRKTYRRQRRLGTLLLRQPWLASGLFKLSKMFDWLGRVSASAGYVTKKYGLLGRYEEDHRLHLGLLEKERAGAQDMGSPYGYEDEQREVKATKYYHRQLLESQLRQLKVESLDLYRHAIATLGDLLASDQAINRVVNFGVSYAYVDSELAKRFPSIEFVGVDRARGTRDFNLEHFGHLGNMRFLADDIFNVLKQGGLDNSLLLHVRTCTFLPRGFIQDLYGAARQAGARYIVGMEPLGISRQTHGAYHFSDQEQESVLFRNAMYIHNYPWLLNKAGYVPRRFETVKTAHKAEDYRILSFTGARS